ncbi:MAG: DUF6807 family protein [Thermoguttaceae bacterium]
MSTNRRFCSLLSVALFTTVAVSTLFLPIQQALSLETVDSVSQSNLVSSASSPNIELRVKNDPIGTIGVFFDKNPLFTYLLNDGRTFKTYLSELYTPNGRNILRDSPADHVHHHSLMYAVTVDGIDFWAEFEREKNGVQYATTYNVKTEQFQNNDESRNLVELSVPVTWLGPLPQNGRNPKPDPKMLKEQRMIEMFPNKEEAVRVLTWTSQFSVPDGNDKEELVLSGSHYFGLGLRFDQSMDKNGTFLSDLGPGQFGPNIRGDEHVTACKWMLYTAKLHDEPVTVAIFDDPRNPRPMHAFTMGQAGNSFAYLSATLNLYKEPLTLKKGESLTLKYGVAVWDGTQTAETVQKAYDRWIEQVTSKR